MGLAEDMQHMIKVAPTGTETVKYCPYKGMPVTRTVHVFRTVLLPDFVGGAESSIVEHQISIVNDATNGVVTIQDGKDQIQMKNELGDRTNTTFRVVSHESVVGSHLLRVRV